MLQHPDYTRTRVRQLTERIGRHIFLDPRPVELLVSPRVDRIPSSKASELEYRTARLGEQFGPLWATFWFKCTAQVPREWAGESVVLMWDSHCEATLWVAGKSRQGLNSPERLDALLLEKARGGETLEFQIELACNGLMGSWSGPPNPFTHFLLERAEITRFDSDASAIYYDLKTLVDLEAEIAKEKPSSELAWAGELLASLNAFANAFDHEDRATWPAAHAIIKKLYRNKNATVVHELSAIGHAHIDTAWLWPLAETERKCERSFSTAVNYMDRYPAYKFSCSQAAQYEIIANRNPDLYQRIKAKVKAGQFVPVGGTWIEPDCNIPSGESLARQFLLGQRYFEIEFGRRCKEFWNPDVFGYNGQLPQIMNLAGITRFLTQKLSWNRFNRPDHHTFTWQGIDGSEVLSHFPPADTYNAVADVAELRKNAREYKDHDRSRHSLMLFGYGDGGGGPTPRMLEYLARAKDVQGLPRTTIRSSDEFFELLEKDITDRPVIIGELYFELHRGTYTTQAANKRDNRKTEFLLHDVEFLATAASRADADYKYPAEELERLWKLVLLNQFHDILPGSSIKLVYEDSAKQYADVLASGAALRERALASLGAKGGAAMAVNTLPFARAEVAITPGGREVFVEAQPYAGGRATASGDGVTLNEAGGEFVLENAHLRATLAATGELVSLIEKQTGRETMAAAGNVLEIYDDHPTNWDAWEVDPYHLETGKPIGPATSAKIVSRSALRVEISFEWKLGKASSARGVARLDANAQRIEFHVDVDWHEAHKFLKVAFPVNVRAMNATYEMQFGCVERPTHYNTSFDLARFEVPGHKWADVSEHGFGVALLSESKYGYSTLNNVMRMSLLRAPKNPDPVADMGKHHFSYALMPHAGGWRQAGVVAEAHRFNVPLVWTDAAVAAESFAGVDDTNLVLDTIKRAEDSAATILRLYECHGARGIGNVRVAFPFKSAAFANLLEDELAPATVKDGAIEVPYGPYQVITLIVK